MKLELTPEDIALIVQVLNLIGVLGIAAASATSSFLAVISFVYKKDLHNAVKIAISILSGVLITLFLHSYFGLLNNPVESIVIGILSGAFGTAGVTLALQVSKPRVLKFPEEEKLEPYPV
jgi:hypothetical protein